MIVHAGHHLFQKKKKNFINYAVPNYGFDQSLLKYENKKLDKNIENIIIELFQKQFQEFKIFGNIILIW